MEGVSNSFITNNLIFNHTNGGIKVMNYNSGVPYILPYDQTGNVIENNTIWQGTRDWHDGEDISSSPSMCSIRTPEPASWAATHFATTSS